MATNWPITGSAGASQKRKAKEPPPHLSLQLPPKKLPNMHLPDACKEQLLYSFPLQHPQNVDNNSWGTITQGQNDADGATLGSLIYVPESLGSLPLQRYVLGAIVWEN